MNIRWWIYDEYSLFDPILDPNKFIPTLYYRPPIATWIYSSHIYLHLTSSGWAVLVGIEAIITRISSALLDTLVMRPIWTLYTFNPFLNRNIFKPGLLTDDAPHIFIILCIVRPNSWFLYLFLVFFFAYKLSYNQ
jgi:hypothetical protein